MLRSKPYSRESRVGSATSSRILRARSRSRLRKRNCFILCSVPRKLQIWPKTARPLLSSAAALVFARAPTQDSEPSSERRKGGPLAARPFLWASKEQEFRRPETAKKNSASEKFHKRQL